MTAYDWDLFEECCPHCGFCGDDHGGRPCGDCLDESVWGTPDA